jgi:hypothetical protein
MHPLNPLPRRFQIGEVVVSRCRDDFWLWAALFAVASSADAQPRSCSCDRDREPSAEEPAERTEQRRQAAAARRREYLIVAPWTVLLVAAIVWKLFSQPTHTTAAISGTEVQPMAMPAVAEAPEAEPPAPPPTVEAEPAPEAIRTPSPPIAEPSLLSAASFVEQTELLPALEPTPLASPFFDVGWTREDVIAAQGSLPTYTAHHDRMWWWGSSRVEFDDAGHVRSWMNGTPPLHVETR